MGSAKSHTEIFIELSKAMGSPIKRPTTSEVKKALKMKTLKPTVEAFSRTEGFDVFSEELLETLNASVIEGSRLLWLKEEEILTFSKK